MTFRLRSASVSALAIAAALGLSAAPALAQSPAEQQQQQSQNTDKTFESFKADAFGDKAIAANADFIKMTAPYRAEDAAVVPIDVAVALPEGDQRTISKVTLIVDENPSPVAATFTLGQNRKEFWISTRLRVNAYSTVRTVVETSDGKLAMNGKFVKASGGCSAPALKDQDEAMARIGQTRFRNLAAQTEGEPAATKFDRAQLMIRHPNYSGLQMNVVDRSYIPAWFVNHLEIRQGDEMVFTMDGGISLSEDPMIQFTYHKKPGAKLAMNGTDTQGKAFSADLQQDAASAQPR
ncbi:quinoprotein dehydrogenase-associated SoxYZ-like carrier [Chenggangzhangella methanolivorans]|uniref:Quinoprotein dehydrogenase-associated SoxYZ-like carrier n=1 Tax=Chenggangzhangella methanolivorans TaxID=1437009 RepID=A0A9E6RFA5_9HYPH|nr:quinoprotein dehydrogenase-associated SoxYZ-like carrier [Chenggangzhangella methanolivorans]QZO00171.1 quinoprotein dehydrogenase-associated SoxYZ-like carrier [Chenggangzhangella methanolivorans]